MKKTNRVTIRTVAADAEVSLSTVSKVVRGAPHVSPDLRSKVEASIERLHYRPHAAARGMRGRTYTLGILLGDIRNTFFPDIVDGMVETLDRTEYKALLGIGRSSAPVEVAMVEAMEDRQMDGVIMIAPKMPASAIEETASRWPTVVIGHHSPDATTFDTVNGNDRVGGRLAGNHLIGKGHKHITFVSTNASDGGEGERAKGLREAMEARGLGAHFSIAVFSEDLARYRSGVSAMLASPDRPTAVFCANDTLALEVLSCAGDLGVSVPEDLAVIGYDNIRSCDYSFISLSSIDQSGATLGLTAVNLLIERIDGRTKAEHFVLSPRLVARRSSAAPAPYLARGASATAKKR